MRALTATPDLDGWAIVEWLLKDLAPLEGRLWLVIDDLHELDSDQARSSLDALAWESISLRGDLEALRREDCVTTRRATGPEAAWSRAVMAGVV